MTYPQKRPAGTGRGKNERLAGALYRTRGNYLPRDWRNRLPAPEQYYALHVDKLGRPNGTGWAQGLCPSHDDQHPSLSVHMAEGGAFRCMACGVKGRDVVAFHMQREGLDFKQAVRDLIGLGVRT